MTVRENLELGALHARPPGAPGGGGGGLDAPSIAFFELFPPLPSPELCGAFQLREDRGGTGVCVHGREQHIFAIGRGTSRWCRCPSGGGGRGN